MAFGACRGSNPLCYRFEDWAFSFSPLTPQLYRVGVGMNTSAGGGGKQCKAFERSNGIYIAPYKNYLGGLGIHIGYTYRD